MSFVLILGATSDIAKSLAVEYAADGYDLYLAARNSHRLEKLADEIRQRFGRRVECFELDVLDYDAHAAFYDRLEEKPIGVIQAVGYLGDQDAAHHDFGEARRIIDTNFTGVVSLLNLIADDFENRKSGFIVGISSVAGERGRRSNYMYGSAKAGLTAYLSGLRNRLSTSNVHVLTVKPGFVATKMTEGRDLPPLLTAHPDRVAKAILRAQRAGKNVLYTKSIWRWIMLVVRSIPEPVFKRMNV